MKEVIQKFPLEARIQIWILHPLGEGGGPLIVDRYGETVKGFETLGVLPGQLVGFVGRVGRHPFNMPYCEVAAY